jgi:hypothetical protein
VEVEDTAGVVAVATLIAEEAGVVTTGTVVMAGAFKIEMMAAVLGTTHHPT